MKDVISRQAVIDAYGDWYVEEGTEEGFIGTVKQLLEGLSSAQPELIEKVAYIRGFEQGRTCGRTVYDDTGYNVAVDFPYCHCGCKMEVEDDGKQ